MEVSVSSQPLIAAFAFGIVANAAGAAAFFFFKGNDPPLFQDSLRLVLVIFLLSSALWAFVDFIAMAIETASGCQIATAFGSAFDQLARAAFEQFLLWRLGNGSKASASTVLVQSAIIVRFVLGGVYVGFQRADFDPVCLAKSSLMPLSISILSVDAAIIASFLAKLMWTEYSEDAVAHEINAQRRKSLVLIIAGAGTWTALSGPMLLGAESLAIVLRTVLPCIGLMILIAIVFLSWEQTDDTTRPRAKPSVDSEPREYRMSDFVRGFYNPPSINTSLSERPSTQHADKMQRRPSTRASRPPPNRNKELPKINVPEPGQSSIGIGGVPVTGQLVPPIKPEWPLPTASAENTRGRDSPQGSQSMQKSGKNKIRGRNVPVISAPVLHPDSMNPLERVAAVDLQTAAEAERQRRGIHPQPLESHAVGVRGPPVSARGPSRNPSNRKPVGRPVVRASTHLEPILESGAHSTTSSAQLSPGVEDIRRRSPRLSQQSFPEPMVPPLPPLKTSRTVNELPTPTNPSAKPDVWELLSVPKENQPDAPKPPPRSPLRPSVTPAAQGFAIMSQSSQPDSSGRPRRTFAAPTDTAGSVGDPTAGPKTSVPLPQANLPSIASVQSQKPKVEPPPPYGQPNSGPPPSRRATMEMFNPPKPASPIVINHSPSRPDMKLSIFPPAYAKPSVASPPKKAPATANVSGITSTNRGRQPTAFNSADNPFSFENMYPTSQRIFMVREIEYDRPTPTQVASVPADKPLPKSPDLTSHESILNRPRPIPRTPETARLLQTHASTKGSHRPQPHRRSLSCSSITPKKSAILHSSPIGSPSQLPPLPPLPHSAADPLKQLPNDTKSMTFDEKMDLFYPASRSPASSRSRRSTRRWSTSLPDMTTQSDVPDVPSLPPKSPAPSRQTPHSESLTFGSIKTKTSTKSSDLLQEPNPPLPVQSYEDNAPQVDTEVPTDTVDNLDHTAASKKSSGTRPVALVQKSPSHPQSPPAENIETSTGQPSPAATEDGQESIVSRDTWEKDDSSPLQSPSPEQIHTDPSPWHHRIGDECPTFSNRAGSDRPRRGPPPTPLLLNQPVRAVLVQAEPSPLDSPEHALGMIEEQLQRLERSSQASSTAEETKMTLIADLEKEMGLQENHWQAIRNTVVRDSSSTINLSPQQDRGTIGESLLAKIHEFRRSNSNLRVETTQVDTRQASSGRYGPSTRSSLAHLSNSGKRMSHLTVSHPASQLGSPTPPDTGESDGEEIDIGMIYTRGFVSGVSKAPSLWRAEVPSPIMIKHMPSLWSPTSASMVVANPMPERQVSDIKPGLKKAQEPLVIESFELWSHQMARNTQENSALWGSSPVNIEEPPTVKPRPLTQKPARKSRRMTTLPDILESPQPLPDKRGTLGIFQFPWGETSDTGTIPSPKYTFTTMPGTMTTGHSNLINPVYAAAIPPFQSFQGHEYDQEQQPSFFDDCDEEDVGDNFSDYDYHSDDDDGDDDFDETTLWEIASLLQSERTVPNRGLTIGEWESFGRRTSVVASPTESVDSPFVLPKSLETRSLDIHRRPRSSLWERRSRSFHARKSVGLPQPDDRTWRTYTAPASTWVNMKRRDDEPDSITSDTLWRANRNERSSPDWLRKTRPETILSTPCLTRIPASKADWRNALEEAIRASQPAPPPQSSGVSLWSQPGSDSQLNTTQPERMWHPHQFQHLQDSTSPILPSRTPSRRASVKDVPSPPDLHDQSLWNKDPAVQHVDKPQNWLGVLTKWTIGHS